MVARNTGTLNRTRVLKNQADEGNIVDDDQVAVKDTRVRNVGDVQSSRWFLNYERSLYGSSTKDFP